MALRLLLLSIVVTALSPGCCPQPQAASSTRSTVAELGKNPPIGRLGLPLGTVTEVRATVLSGSELRTKQYESAYLLRVTQVAQRALAEPVVIEFSLAPGSAVKLARNNFDLYEMKNGQETGKLDSDQIRQLEQGYVGKEFHLKVYESGGFSGIPQNLPGEALSWQDHCFGFTTSLDVLTEIP